MADGKIYIIVTDQLPAGQGPLTPDKQKDKKEEKDSSLKDFASHKFFNFIESQAKQAVNYGISNIGNFTGDYVKQQQVNGAKELLSFGMELGAAVIAGFKYTGSPWGSLIAAGVVVAGKGITIGEQLLSQAAETSRQNRYIDQLRTRAGLNSTNNGSRGTEY